jgi:hypothetical protein
MSPAIGKIDNFDESVEDWESYTERLEEYFKANDVGNNKKVSCLIATMGPKTYGLLKSLTAPAKPSASTFDEIKATLLQHLSPTPIVIAERFRYYMRNQASGESVAEYVAVLKKLSTNCKFGGFLDEALRDRLVCGISSKTTQERLLCEKELDFQKASGMAIAQETAVRDAKQLQKGASSDVHAIKSSEKTPRSSCFRCGRTHDPDECWFKDENCHKCGRRGHISRKCKGKPQKKETKRHDSYDERSKIRGKKNRKGNKKVHKVEISDESSEIESDTDVDVYAMFSMSSKKDDAIWIQLNIASTPVRMELDTGSAVSVMNFKEYQDSIGESWPLKPTSVLLKTYTGQKIQPRGEVEVPVDYDGDKHNLILYVVDGKDCPPLLGRDWLREIRLDWRTVKLLSSTVSVEQKLEHILQKNGDLFKEELGTMKNIKAKVNLKEGQEPKYFKARPMAYAMKPKVEKELDSLIERGIISPVTYSEWATPIVPVVKGDCSVRICGDFKVTLNQAIKVDQFSYSKN